MKGGRECDRTLSMIARIGDANLKKNIAVGQGGRENLSRTNGYGPKTIALGQWYQQIGKSHK